MKYARNKNCQNDVEACSHDNERTMSAPQISQKYYSVLGPHRGVGANTPTTLKLSLDFKLLSNSNDRWHSYDVVTKVTTSSSWQRHRHHDSTVGGVIIRAASAVDHSWLFHWKYYTQPLLEVLDKTQEISSIQIGEEMWRNPTYGSPFRYREKWVTIFHYFGDSK